MQKIALILLSITLLTFGCKKENKVDLAKSNLIGKWELGRSICGECAVSLTTYPTGNGNFIIFGEDGSFERKKNDSLIFKGIYSLIISKECSSSGDQAIITSEFPDAAPQFISVFPDSLELRTPSCYQDGGSIIYSKVSK